jgi:hypothetical protein
MIKMTVIFCQWNGIQFSRTVGVPLNLPVIDHIIAVELFNF